MNPAFAVTLAIVAIDSVGIGLVMPVLPGLLRHLAHTDRVATLYGALMAAYAAMQFLFSPILGTLSDRFGRRPILLGSLAGAAIDYVVAAAAPDVAIFAAGRTLAGISGASMAVAFSVVADLTRPEARARRFGLISAVFGLGLVAGPIAGGLLGGFSLRAPFLFAAALNAINFAAVLAFLPETRPAGHRRPRLNWRLVVPSFAIFRIHPGLPRLITAYALMTIAAQVPFSCWILYCQARYGFDARTVGLSLALYGLLHAVAQSTLVAPIGRRLGERGGVVLATFSDATASTIFGLASRGWAVFTLMPLWCLGGTTMPLLQSLLSREVPADEQGRLQGALVSLGSLIGIPGPLVATALLSATSASAPGAIWIGAAALELLALLPLMPNRASALDPLGASRRGLLPATPPDRHH